MAHHTHGSEVIEQDGLRWFIGASIIAVLLAIFLYRIDEGLEHWDIEARRAETIGELRRAQTMIPAGDIDPRTAPGAAAQAGPRAAAQAGH